MLDGGGLSWADTSQLTLSFAPDGTDIAGEPSVLHQTFDSIARRAEWTEAVLRAFQVWARPTTANIGVVNERHARVGSVGPRPIDAGDDPDAGGEVDASFKDSRSARLDLGHRTPASATFALARDRYLRT